MNLLLIDKKAKIPKLGSLGSAGYDLFSCGEHIILPQERKMISTGIVFEIPEGYYGRIAPRSGLALKYGIDVLAGVIDSDYRGEIGVILYNTDKNNSFHIKEHERIAQIIFEKCYYFSLVEKQKLSSTKRNCGGFGSTGK